MPPLADLLSLSRLAIAPVVPAIATFGASRATAILIMWGLVSDALDGMVARRTGAQSDRGARLDSICDVAFYSAAIAGFVIAFPAAGAELRVTWIVTGVSLVMPSLFGWLKFSVLPSYHTILSRLTLVAFGCALVTFYVVGVTWPFRIAGAVALLSALDDMLITSLLAAPRSRVPHSLSLLRRAAVHRAEADSTHHDRMLAHD